MSASSTISARTARRPGPISYDGANGAGGFQCNGAYQVTQRFTPFASIIFSELNENLWTGQADLSYKIDSDRPITLSTGYFYQGTDRYSSRIQFNYQTSDGAGTAPGFPYNLYRPDYLLSPDVINNACPLRAEPKCTLQLQFSTQAGAYAMTPSSTSMRAMSRPRRKCSTACARWRVAAMRTRSRR